MIFDSAKIKLIKNMIMSFYENEAVTEESALALIGTVLCVLDYDADDE
jgi:hypothetical protein